ncbi:hypothetical protein CEP49_05900 [Mergibacter septicus]|uniref:DarT1-associated NADAR antitoxin family protein n=1 Tax=Mergibacter septicus TaxID=221402 RepID=UPI0011798423|nr:hypothetical protein [Mergibacter septicus]AWX14114.1 hypothetical protein CEP49_05900 [Mergibacter septicus]
MNKTGKTKRPIFIPKQNGIGFVEKEIEFDWHMGMSSEVRKRSVKSLHENAKKIGISKILEASSKSENPIGIRLSAFHLKNIEGVAVENLFQSSKVFKNGGPYEKLLRVTPKEAKKYERLKNSGELIKFEFNGKEFPLEPKTLFYDWLYLQVLFSEKNLELREQFFEENFEAFSDIEYNPKKSFSCQARTLAICVSLYKNESVQEFIDDPEACAKKYSIYEKINCEDTSQGELF